MANKPTPKRIVVTGGRNYKSVSQLTDILDANIADGDVLVTGDVGGAEKLAAAYAKARGLVVELMPADWSHIGASGKKTGWVKRNDDMLASRPDHIFVFDFDAEKDACVLNIIDQAKLLRIPGTLVVPPAAEPEPEWGIIG